MLKALLIAALALGHSTPALTGCTHRAQVRPHQVVIACADGNFYADKLVWSSWSAKSAGATGTAHVNDCKPYCAAGHFHTYPVTIRLSHVETCGTSRQMFARIEWVFPAAKPSDQPRAGGETLPCTFLKLKP